MHINHLILVQHSLNIGFCIPEADGHGRRGWYPQRLSLNAFKMWHSDGHKHYWQITTTHEWMMKDLNQRKECQNTPYIIVECESVWDFYDKVGYDYKRKKFVDPNRTFTDNDFVT